MPGALPWGNELLLAGSFSVSQVSITALPNGPFVAGWRQFVTNVGNEVVLASFDAAGVKTFGGYFPDPTQVTDTTDPAVMALSDGRFVAAWTVTTPNHNVFSEVIDATKSPPPIVVPKAQVNTVHTSAIQDIPDIAPLAGNAGYVVVFEDQEDLPIDVRAQMYDFAGNKIGPAELFVGSSPTLPTSIHVAGLNSGGFVVTWDDVNISGGSDSIRGQIINASGQPVGGNFLSSYAGHSYDPDVAVLSDGRFAVVWGDNSGTLGDTSSFGVHGQIFNANGTSASAEFLVNTQTLNRQEAPIISALHDGGFAVAWADTSGTFGDGSSFAVHAQVFNSNGGKSGTEFLVNTTTLHNQIPQSITTLADGRFVVAYTDSSAGDNAQVARAQIFDPRDAAVTLPGTVLADDLVGTPFGDSISGGANNDRLAGALGNDTLIGGAGGDALNGGDGTDTASYANAPAGLQAGLEDAQANTGDAAGDSYISVENLVGSAFDDVLYATQGVNRLTGGVGNDLFVGKGGGDTFDGGAGSDTAAYDASFASLLRVDLLSPGTNTGDAAGDVYISIENLAGSSFNDMLLGDNNANFIGGNTYPDTPSGQDQIFGRGGNDTLSGYDDNDSLDGGAGFDTAVYSSARSAYTVTRSGATVTVNGPDGVDTLTGVERLQFANGFMSLRTENDFNGDGRSDVLFSSQGAVFASNYEWQLNNRSLLSQGAVDLYDKAFTVQLVGDYDGDSKSDVLFQNPTTGGVWEWRLDGRAIVSQGAVDVGDPAYHLLGTGDFNGDGKDDLLFRNAVGFVYEWQMNGRVNTPLPVGALAPVWHVQGTGDFNGDGKDDILLRNISTVANENGAYFLWQMNGNLIQTQAGIERPPTAWKTLGVGDFDGDGIDDFAVRNVSATADNGAVWVYLMNGTTIKAQGAAGIANAATWHLQQIGDLDGDGKDDILYRNDAGYFYSWNMNGTHIASEGLLQGAAQWADPGFKVVQPHWDLV